MRTISASALFALSVIGCGNLEADPELDGAPELAGAPVPAGHYSDDVEADETGALEQAVTSTGGSDYYNCVVTGNCPSPSLKGSSSCLDGRDYSPTVTSRSGDIVVLSFHGGKIEPGSSEVASTLATKYGWSSYDFAGHGTSTCLGGGTDFTKLHITSTGFDDPAAVKLVSSKKKAVAIHGYDDSRGNRKGTICVGGANTVQIKAFIDAINASKARFSAYSLTAVNSATGAVTSGVDCSGLTGTARLNLVNRVSTGLGGLQLEMSNAIKADLLNPSATYNELRNVFYGAVKTAMAN